MAETFLPPFRAQPTAIALGESVDWSLSNAHDLWKQTKGEGVKVAVLDNGCDLTHPDLVNQIDSHADFTKRGFVKGNHGTPVCSLIAGEENGSGIIGGAPKVRLHVGQVMYGNSGLISWMIDGIYWSIDVVNADVINISAGFPVGDAECEKAIRYGLAKGKLFAIAAGNDGRDNSVNYPAKWTGGIASFNRARQLSRFSSRGPEIICACPGEGITAAAPGGGHSIVDGTSFSAPFFAAMASLVLAKHKLVGGKTPLRNQEELIEHVKEAVDDLGATGFDNGWGWGALLPDKFLGREEPNPMQPADVWLPKIPLGKNWAVCRRQA